MTPKPDHLSTLIRFQAWRRDVSERQRKDMPDPAEIGRALDWAIKELRKMEPK